MIVLNNILPPMTIPSLEQQCVMPVEETNFRWPAHIAKSIADTIHRQVVNTLSTSRLVRKADTVELFNKDDILRIEKTLGSGAFSKVSSVITKDGRRFAFKHLKNKLMNQPDSFRLAAAELAYEAHMLASFDHPHILKVRGWARNGIASFEEGCNDSFFLLLDVLDETLDQRIDRWLGDEQRTAFLEQSLCRREFSGVSPAELLMRLRNISSPVQSVPTVFPEETRVFATVRFQRIYLEKLQIMSEIASAIDYIHKRGVIFRDLKPNNIGFLGDRVQIFDFGLSRELPALDTSIPFEMSGKVGTLRYMAPEVALHQPYNVSADIYSWAIVSYELLSLQKPFNGWTRDMHCSMVCRSGVRPDTNRCIHPIPMNMRALLQHAWQTSPSLRPDMPTIANEIAFLKKQQIAIMQEHQLQLQLSQQLEAQRNAQQDALLAAAAAAADNNPLLLDMSYLSAPSHPRKRMSRHHSTDSMETIETSPLSGDSLDF